MSEDIFFRLIIMIATDNKIIGIQTLQFVSALAPTGCLLSILGVATAGPADTACLYAVLYY